MKLGIVGTGLIVRLIGPHLSEWRVDATAIAGTPSSVDQVDELADQFGAAGRYTDYNDLIADPEVDTVYVAVPNFLHYVVSEAALLAGKDVVCEKPLAANEREARRIAEVARAHGRFLWEGIVTTRQPNFKLIKEELLPRIGTVKVASVNYSQYSSRYDAFRAGEVLPAFDPAKAGGAIMDLGLYTLSFALGLFGKPRGAVYFPNIERGIDTSGVAVLTYDGHVVTAICAKDCGSTGREMGLPSGALIEGTEGYIKMDTPPNVCGPVTLHLNDGSEQTFDQSLPIAWQGEWLEFVRQQDAGDLQECYRQLDESVLVSSVQNDIRRKAGVVFPSDED